MHAKKDQGLIDWCQNTIQEPIKHINFLFASVFLWKNEVGLTIKIILLKELK